jgi:hypothetical protein
MIGSSFTQAAADKAKKFAGQAFYSSRQGQRIRRINRPAGWHPWQAQSKT